MKSNFLLIENLTHLLSPQDVKTFSAASHSEDPTQMLLILKLIVRNIAHNELIVDDDTSLALVRATSSNSHSEEQLSNLRIFSQSLCENLEKMYNEDSTLILNLSQDFGQ